MNSKKALTLMILTLIGTFTLQAQAQMPFKGQTGSWINENIVKYYMGGKEKSCSIEDFDNDKYIPLSISFKEANELILSLRIEQRKAYYKATYYKGELISISNKINVYKVRQSNNVLVLNYRGNKISFRKVSNTFSNNVFMEFIKNLIFKSNKSLKLSIRGCGKPTEVTKQNLLKKLNAGFRGNMVEFVELGTYKSGDKCLPEIAIYQKNEGKWERPQILGILINDNEVKFIDTYGNTEAILQRN